MTIANVRLRVLVERAVRVFEDHKGAHPALEDFGQILPTSAAAYIEAYDTLMNFGSTRVRHMAEGHGKIRALDKLIRTWSGVLSVTIPAFDANELRGSIHKPDVLLQDAKRLLEVLEPERARLQRADELFATLTTARAEALEEWTTAQRTLARHRELQHAVGGQRDEMERVFEAFRLTLEEILGVDHRDCQMLRTPRSRGKKDEKAAETKAAEQKTESKADDKDTRAQDENEKKPVAAE